MNGLFHVLLFGVGNVQGKQFLGNVFKNSFLFVEGDGCLLRRSCLKNGIDLWRIY